MRLFGAIILTGILGVTTAQAQTPAGCCENSRTLLDISAQAEVKSSPDIAMISSGVVTIAKTANKAMADNAAKMTSVMAALKKAGIDEKDVQTSGISLNPQYNYVQNMPPQIVNYQANNNVSIKLRDMKTIGPVLDALIAEGSNQLNGPTFSVDKPDALLDGARKEAMKKALDRAALYAAASNMKIKRIAHISEQADNNPPAMPMASMRMMAAKMESASTPVATGEVAMSVTVNLTIELE